MEVEVEGAIQGGVLMASKLEARDGTACTAAIE